MTVRMRRRAALALALAFAALWPACVRQIMVFESTTNRMIAIKKLFCKKLFL